MPTLDALSSPLIPALISSYSMHWQVRSRKPPHIILKYIHAQVKNSNENCSLDMSETKHCLSQVSFTFISRSPLRISFICAPFLSNPPPPSIAHIPDVCLFVSCFEHAGLLWVFCVWEYLIRTTSVQPFPYWVTDSQERETDRGAQRVQTNDSGLIMVPLWVITTYKGV